MRERERENIFLLVKMERKELEWRVEGGMNSDMAPFYFYFFLQMLIQLCVNKRR